MTVPNPVEPAFGEAGPPTRRKATCTNPCVTSASANLLPWVEFPGEARQLDVA